MQCPSISMNCESIFINVKMNCTRQHQCRTNPSNTCIVFLLFEGVEYWFIYDLKVPVHNVFSTVTFPPWLHPVKNMASHDQIMEKTQKFQIVYAGLTNLCQHSTIDLVRGIMTNERKQSALLKARSFKHSKTTSSFFVSNL